ncbi:protein FAR1-related sequence 5 [Tanacetum coccineum]
MPAFHRKRCLLCKQEEAGVQLNAEQADWKDDTDDESEEQELEAQAISELGRRHSKHMLKVVPYPDTTLNRVISIGAFIESSRSEGFDLGSNPKTLDEAFSLDLAAEACFTDLQLWEFLRSYPLTLGEAFFRARITEAHYEDENNQAVDANVGDQEEPDLKDKQVKKANDLEIKIIQDEEGKNAEHQQVSEADDDTNIDDTNKKADLTVEEETNKLMDSSSSITQNEELYLGSSTFESCDDLLKSVRAFYYTKGYGLSIRDSKKTSKKGTDGTWVLKIHNLEHNHEPSTDMSGHPSFCRLPEEDVHTVKNMTLSGIPPRHIISSLRKKSPNLPINSRTIYNLKAKPRKDDLGNRSLVGALLEELEKGGFSHDVDHDSEGRITRITLSLDLVHPHWRIDTLSLDPEDDAHNEIDEQFAKLLNELQSKYQAWPLSKKELATSMLTKFLNQRDILFEPVIQRPRGRPRKAKKKRGVTSTTRDPSRFEYVESSQAHDPSSSSNGFPKTIHPENGVIDLNAFPDF